MISPFVLERPRSVAEAVQLLKEDSVAYCGGTEILLAMKMGLLRPDRLVDLKGIAELGTITVADGQLVIGAGASHDDVERHPEVRARVPLLAEVAARVGNVRVRAQGSIGGNLCFAEPRSDLTTTLVALGADLTLESPAGRRTVKMADFLLGAYWTSREDDELLVDVRVADSATPGVYLKYQTAERPVVGVAAVELDGGSLRVVVGAVSDIPTVVEAPTRAGIDAVAIADGLDLVDDSAGSVRYKRHVTAVYINRAIDALLARSAK